MQTRLGLLLLACAVHLVLGAGGGAAQERRITIASWGSEYQKAQREAWFDAVKRDLGITIREETTTNIADIRVQVASGKPTWDLVDQGNFSCALLERDGLLEKLDPAIVATPGIPDNMKSEYWIANTVFSTVLGWRAAAYPDTKPEKWADMWDLKRFPGPRSLRRSPVYSLEAALLADGVSPQALYPLDISRAFRKLKELKPHVLTWWNSGADSMQLLQGREVDMLGIWNGRVQSLIKTGAAVEFTYNQQMLLFDCWLVPKGAPNKDLAMQALAHMLTPEAQARFPLLINYAPANEKAYATGIIPPEVAANLPNSPQNAPKGFTLDAKWWATNLDEVTKQFDQFIQE